MAVRPRGLATPFLAADLGSRVRLHVLAEHHVVGHEDAVDARLVGGPGPVEHWLPPAVAGIGRRVRPQHDREPGGHHGFLGLLVQRPLLVVRNQPPATSVPPSVGMTWPVTNRERCDARNTTTSALSSG